MDACHAFDDDVATPGKYCDKATGVCEECQDGRYQEVAGSSASPLPHPDGSKVKLQRSVTTSLMHMT